MRNDNRLIDDLARLGGNAVGALAGLRREIDTLVRERIEALLTRMDLVTRDEFEAVREMAIRAREEQERLAERLAALEGYEPGAHEATGDGVPPGPGRAQD